MNRSRWACEPTGRRGRLYRWCAQVRCSTRPGELREVPGRACAVGIQQIQACGWAGRAAGRGVRLGRVCGWASESGRLWANTLTAVPLRPCVPTAQYSLGHCPLAVPTHHDRQAAQPRLQLRLRAAVTVPLHCQAAALRLRVSGTRLWPTGRPAVPAPRASKAVSESLKYCAKIWDDE